MISKILNNTVLLHQTTPCPLSFKQMVRKADPTIYTPLPLNNKHRQQQTISNKQKAEPFHSLSSLSQLWLVITHISEDSTSEA